mmetsp:Transcript_11121/g.23337  ORF Transcript_11121/g.23337 Transcript_11121/m.23337 type:complete len:261 (+) Transcript_11121:574-1356(+)
MVQGFHGRFDGGATRHDRQRVRSSRGAAEGFRGESISDRRGGGQGGRHGPVDRGGNARGSAEGFDRLLPLLGHGTAGGGPRRRRAGRGPERRRKGHRREQPQPPHLQNGPRHHRQDRVGFEGSGAGIRSQRHHLQGCLRRTPPGLLPLRPVRHVLLGRRGPLPSSRCRHVPHRRIANEGAGSQGRNRGSVSRSERIRQTGRRGRGSLHGRTEDREGLRCDGSGRRARGVSGRGQFDRGHIRREEQEEGDEGAGEGGGGRR